METVKIEVQHAEHREWLNKIDFYYDDLKIMRHRLEEVAARNTNKSLMAQVEHFQNQFVIQRNELDEMKHAIHQAESVPFRPRLRSAQGLGRACQASGATVDREGSGAEAMTGP